MYTASKWWILRTYWFGNRGLAYSEKAPAELFIVVSTRIIQPFHFNLFSHSNSLPILANLIYKFSGFNHRIHKANPLNLELLPPSIFNQSAIREIPTSRRSQLSRATLPHPISLSSTASIMITRFPSICRIKRTKHSVPRSKHVIQSQSLRFNLTLSRLRVSERSRNWACNVPTV